ncbi:hypothetical protein [Neogemmobacter tilapiae]|uniref:Uncharacterized protein n=1 Tax=Neogemmobacter tilapiae TaxID=875041 RepID=A0A918TN39_9RHOB|nr:hypothetical protein [Gemmobacter tilapiae]GHC52393.1 hypothetical protein GCM10007315_13590 [Gemmobacter tilapiae]
MKIRAGRRSIKLRNRSIETPCLIPSYSSRARPPERLQLFLDKTLKEICSPVLLSAYDLYHRLGLDIPYDVFSHLDEAPSPAVVLDSGGYEEIWNQQWVAADVIKSDSTRSWSEDFYYTLLADWDSKTELVAVTYDHEMPMPEQIARAQGMAKQFPWLTVTILLKPVSKKSSLDVAAIAPYAKQLAEFSIIGVTEKEIGASMGERLKFLCELRDCLTAENLHIPIHVFGGLEPSMSALYFMAGADIFDGLSWLRYAYTAAGSLYDQSYSSIDDPMTKLEDVMWKRRLANLIDLDLLRKSMIKLVEGASIEQAFGERGPRIRAVWDLI